MDQQEILKNTIKTFSNYYEKQRSFESIISYDPVISKALEVFDVDMEEMAQRVFDLMKIPFEDSPEKNGRENWTRDICLSLIKLAAEEEKYIAPAVELITDWRNLNDYTSKVKSHTWFYHSQLLDAHLSGYKENSKEEKQTK